MRWLVRGTYRLSLHARDRLDHGAWITHGPATAAGLADEVTDDAVEVHRVFDVEGMATVGHDG